MRIGDEMDKDLADAITVHLDFHWLDRGLKGDRIPCSYAVCRQNVPAQFDQIIQSWDMAYKNLATSDYVVGQVWGAFKADRYLLDQVRSRWDMPATKAAVQELSRRSWISAHIGHSPAQRYIASSGFPSGHTRPGPVPSPSTSTW